MSSSPARAAPRASAMVRLRSPCTRGASRRAAHERRTRPAPVRRSRVVGEAGEQLLEQDAALEPGERRARGTGAHRTRTRGAAVSTGRVMSNTSAVGPNALLVAVRRTRRAARGSRAPSSPGRRSRCRRVTVRPKAWIGVTQRRHSSTAPGDARRVASRAARVARDARGQRDALARDQMCASSRCRRRAASAGRSRARAVVIERPSTSASDEARHDVVAGCPARSSMCASGT